MEEDYEIAIKVVIVGNGAVGKSSMIQRYCKGIFTRDYKKTIGVDFLERELEHESETIRLMLWDTAGQEEFDAITKTYYRGAQACVLAFSTTDRDSFDAIPSWKQKVEAEVGDIPMVLVQNKIDLLHQAQVTESEVENLAQKLNIKLYKTSVKENLNIDAVFEYLTSRYFSVLNMKIVEQAKQCSIGPSLSSLRNSTSSKQSNGRTGNKLSEHTKTQAETEFNEIKTQQKTSRYSNHHQQPAHSSHKDKKKERCIIS